MERFTPDADSKLILTVGSFPMLFQLSHPHFKIRGYVYKIWNGIILKLNDNNLISSYTRLPIE